MTNLVKSPTYNGLGLRLTAPDNTQTTTTYDPNGNVLTVTDANHHTVTNVYDNDDRLIQTTNGRGDVVKYTYDGPNGYGSPDRNGVTQYGLLSSKTDGNGNGHVTTYAYTARNEPFQTVYADGTSENCAYDWNGNVTDRTNPNGVHIVYVYDKDNRLTDILYPHLTKTHFDYDADGRKIDMTDASGTTSWLYTYDGIHESQQANPQGTITYTYDGDGRLSTKSANVTGVGVVSTWTNGYDPGGRLTSLRSTLDGTTTYTYDGPSGRGTKDASGQTQYGLLSMKTFGNGNYDTYTYDACNEVASIGFYNLGGNYQNGLVYTYDPAGNVQTCNQGFYATTYGYDGADQLVSETGSGTYAPPSYGYTFDHNGNRLTQTTNGAQVQSFTYDGHDKLMTGTGETDGYDAAGNQKSVLLSGTTSTRTFDDEDRLTSISGPGYTDTFTYNGLGLRVGKTDSTGTYLYVCDDAGRGGAVKRKCAVF